MTEYSQPVNEDFQELSVEETLDRAGLSLEEVADPFSTHHNPQPACCECGSYVEPDGVCPHGHPSVLKKKGLI